LFKKWIEDLNIRTKILHFTGKIREYAGSKGQGFPQKKTAGTKTNTKCGQMGLSGIKQLLHNKRNGP
jgi:hypothetical protein